MDALDQIPWKDLTHAYGSAADVPELLRTLRTASPDLNGEDSPLWHLFGNIWHQGTVYEATAYAVPFLIELAVDRQTPDRAGIFSLLAAIASASSCRGAQELLWARQSHDAVAAGFVQFVDMTNEQADIRFAAAHVLSQFPDRGAEVAAVLRKLLADEQRTPYRAGLLLLIGAAGDLSRDTLAVLSDAARSAEAIERHAAAFAIARLSLRPLPDDAYEAIMEATATRDLEASLQDFPWVELWRLAPTEVSACLDTARQNKVIDGLIESVESGGAITRADTLVNLLFPPAAGGKTPSVTIDGMTARQLRAVRALYEAMKGGERIFYGHFPIHGLPDTMREWRELASGREPSPVDDSLPLLADANHPRKAIAPRKLKVGQKVIHRYFGHGTVLELAVAHPFTGMTIRFDEEGVKQLSLPSDGSPLPQP